MMEEYSEYCDAEANKREDAITSAARTLSDLSAVIEESSASIDSLSEEVRPWRRAGAAREQSSRQFLACDELLCTRRGF